MRNKRTWAAAYMASAALSYVATTNAGDIEHDCDNNGFEVHEHVSSMTVTWTLFEAQHAGMDKICPGFPPQSTGGCSWSNNTDPGFQSLYNAMYTWSSCLTPQTSYKASALTFDLTFPPNSVDRTTNVNPNDSFSRISLIPPNGYFTGATGALAITTLNIDATNGNILNGDIAINTYNPGSSTAPYYTMIEYNVAKSLYIESNDDLIGNVPQFGYADLEGTLVHKLGHYVGLGHSLIEGSATSSGSAFPSMFPGAQAEPFTNILLDYYTTGCNTDQASVGGIIYGRSAKTLHADDIISLAREYPWIDPTSGAPHSFSKETGTITGTILDANGTTTLPGLAVVAVGTNDPEQNRIQTLSYAAGVYTLTVPPGDYYVYVESVDQDPAGGDAARYYFTNLDAPTYIGIPAGAPGCVTPPNLIQTEFYNSSDATAERQCAATLVSVTANASTSGINIVTSYAANMLGVNRVQTSGASPFYYSPRGRRLLLDPTAGTAQVEYRVKAGTACAGMQYQVRFSLSRILNPVAGELDQIPTSSGTGIPATATGTLDGNGDALIRVTYTTASQFDTIYAQASVTPSPNPQALPTKYSNVSVVWIIQ